MEFLSVLSAHWLPLLIGLVAAIGLSYVAWRLFRDKPATISFIVQILKGIEIYMKDLLGDKWAPAYDALVDACEAAIDGTVTQEEAKIIARDTFDKSLEVSGVILGDEEKKACYYVLDTLITILMKDKPAAIGALMQVR